MKQLMYISLLLWGCNLNDDGITAPDQGRNDSETIAVCGNEIEELGEQCDTNVPDEKSCQAVGLKGGIAVCSADCLLDYSNCSASPTCGNGNLDNSEQCDGDSLDEETCQTRGFDQGTLVCNNECIFDDSNCTICGNGELSENEICDENNFGDRTCATENADNQWIGDLGCNNCQELDLSGCFEVTPQIIAAREFNCRLKYDGKVDCWNSEDVLPHDGTFIKISTGSFHVCGLKNDGQVECWGENSEGQNDVPNEVFKDVIADGRYTCALKLNGSIQCWGEGRKGQTAPPMGEDFRNLSGGKEHACAIDASGGIQCWGTWTDGIESRSYPAGPNQPYKAVTSGRDYDCGLKTNGVVNCWGIGTQVPIIRRGGFSKLSTNTYHTCGLDSDGNIACWGDAEFGKTNSRTGPFIDVSTGYHHSCGMKPDLSVECWGINPNNIGSSTSLYYKGQTIPRPAP